VVHDDAIAELQIGHAGAKCDDLTRRLVATGYVLVGLGSFSEMLPVDRSEVASTDGGGLHGEEDLSLSRSLARHVPEVNISVAGKVGGEHVCVLTLADSAGGTRDRAKRYDMRIEASRAPITRM
jgi:hypothetical protein